MILFRSSSSRTWEIDRKQSEQLAHYLRENFYITPSGNFRTQTLTEVMLDVSPDRILYSLDYPSFAMGIAAEWFDHAAISEADRFKIGCWNAQRLFHF